MSSVSIISPLSPSTSTCGYCGPPGKRSQTKSNYHQSTCIPIQLTCQDYQDMIDHGWRRSGTFCYKPDLKRSCCPQYTIKLDALAFKPSKSQRKHLNRWNRFVLFGDAHDDHAMDDVDDQRGLGRGKGKKSSSKSHTFSLVDVIHASEDSFLKDQTSVHKFEVTLEPSSYSAEKFALYESYQRQIHHEDHVTSGGFKRFLIESPLHLEPIQYISPRPAHLPEAYGSYHQLYRLDGELIAVGVIDILPNCVSSVYFMYERKWERFSLGKLSALRETSLAKEMHDAGVVDMTSLYMGFYVHSCPKMRYKGEYSPSYLVDPEEYTWVPFEVCRPLLDKYRYACFVHPEHSIEGSYTGGEHAPQVSDELLAEAKVCIGARDGKAVVIPITAAREWQRPAARSAILCFLETLSEKLVQDMVIYFAYEFDC